MQLVKTNSLPLAFLIFFQIFTCYSTLSKTYKISHIKTKVNSFDLEREMLTTYSLSKTYTHIVTVSLNVNCSGPVASFPSKLVYCDFP
jgi:hypothetical protein